MAPLSTFSAKLLPTVANLIPTSAPVKDLIPDAAQLASQLRPLVKSRLDQGTSSRDLAKEIGGKISHTAVLNFATRGDTPQAATLEKLRAWAERTGMLEESDTVEVPTAAELLRIRQMLGEITAIVDRYVPGKGSTQPAADAVRPTPGRATRKILEQFGPGEAEPGTAGEGGEDDPDT